MKFEVYETPAGPVTLLISARESCRVTVRVR
jgi:hypothetical protein